MRGKDFLEKLSLADPTYVEEAEKAEARRQRIPRGAFAACLLIVVFAAVYFLRPGTGRTVVVGGLERVYTDAQITAGETDVVWPWEYMTPAEQYTSLTWDGRLYGNRGREISPSLLSDTLGEAEASGYDSYEDKQHELCVPVRAIGGVASEQLIAAQLGEAYYVFYRSEYDPPATFGEVLDAYNLSQTLPLVSYGVDEDGTETGCYTLTDDTAIWTILTACRDAAFLETETFAQADGITFTATSEALGVYKRAFTITAGGLLRTNIFDYAYTFDIGAEAAGEILTYVQTHGKPAEREPYTETLAGKIVSIGDGWLFLDDSLLCADPSDGLEFRISTEDLRIRRRVEVGGLAVGDLVVVSFSGRIDTAAGNLVTGAFDIQKGSLGDGGVSVPE